MHPYNSKAQTQIRSLLEIAILHSQVNRSIHFRLHPTLCSIAITKTRMLPSPPLNQLTPKQHPISASLAMPSVLTPYFLLKLSCCNPVVMLSHHRRRWRLIARNVLDDGS